MMIDTSTWKDFVDGKNWENGSVQEIVIEDGETREEAIAFMRKALVDYERTDLIFWEQEIIVQGTSFFFKLRLANMYPLLVMPKGLQYTKRL